jgi:4-alpha-glucanotransferase
MRCRSNHLQSFVLAWSFTADFTNYVETMTADLWGVSYGYTDTEGVYHETPAHIRQQIRRALGAPDDPTVGPPDDGAIVTSASDRWTINAHAVIFTESGGEIHISPGWEKPTDFPLGYHRIKIEGQELSRAFIAAPDSCALPDDFHGWGWAAQLYAVRSDSSWGIGDFNDLQTLNRWSASRGARYTLINPLHAATPTEGQQASPYFPTSRIWRNPLFLHIEHIQGWETVAAELEPVVAQAHALQQSRRIDRTQVRALKMEALHRLWQLWNEAPTPAHQTFSAWRKTEGTSIENYGVYSALVERHGGDSREWPITVSRASASGVASVAAELAERVSFHAWVQWLVEGQLTKANDVLAVMTDLAIGVDRAGADAWVWPESFSRGMSVGAPPDTFNTQGQNWGLAPFDPWQLRRANYEPFIRTVRAAIRGAGALRMDHVMGLFRLWWIPEGQSPSEGCYVYLPYRDLTAILALESHRANVGVVGEDLGTIEPYVSTELAQRKILSYKLVQFESGPTADLPTDSMVAITTHDLPTLAGTWTGSDVVDGILAETVPNFTGLADVRAALGFRSGIRSTPGGPTDANIDELLSPLSESDRTLLLRALPLGSLAASADAAGLSPEQFINRLHHIAQQLSSARLGEVPQLLVGMLHDLATSKARLIAATLDDALGVEDRPNLPGTTDQRPNWQIALPILLEELLQHEGVQATADILSERNRTVRM